MIYSNPKAVTIKLPREPFTPSDQDHMLDIALACAYPGAHPPTSDAERMAFERHIETGSESEISQRVKNALADLTEEERKLLFR